MVQQRESLKWGQFLGGSKGLWMCNALEVFSRRKSSLLDNTARAQMWNAWSTATWDTAWWILRRELREDCNGVLLKTAMKEPEAEYTIEGLCDTQHFKKLTFKAR